MDFDFKAETVLLIFSFAMPILLIGAGWIGLKLKKVIEKGGIAASVIIGLARLVDEVVEYYAAKNPEIDLFDKIDEIVNEILNKAGISKIKVSKDTARRLAAERITVFNARKR